MLWLRAHFSRPVQTQTQFYVGSEKHAEVGVFTQRLRPRLAQSHVHWSEATSTSPSTWMGDRPSGKTERCEPVSVRRCGVDLNSDRPSIKPSSCRHGRNMNQTSSLQNFCHWFFKGIRHNTVETCIVNRVLLSDSATKHTPYVRADGQHFIHKAWI